MLDSFDRQSFDSKGQQIHRSAMHAKNNTMMPPKGHHDPNGGLHTHKKNTIVNTENHYLPNISPNYTSVANGVQG